MPLEEGFLSLLIGGFSVLILIILISTVFLYKRNKENKIAYIMIIIHLILLSLSFYFFVDTITLDIEYNHPMASEEYSLHLGLSFLLWGISMLSLLGSIFKFSTQKK